MGKRRNEPPPGGDGDHHIPKTKPSLREDLEATRDDSLDVAEPAQTGDANGKLKSRGQTTHSSAATNAPRSVNSDGEAAVPEQSQAGGCTPSPLPQERGEMGIGGGGKSPEATALGAASQPESPQWANSVADETEKERHGSSGEEPDAETPTHGGTGNIGDSPERSCTLPAQGEGAAGREMALPADTPGWSTGSCPPAEMPDPHREEGVNGGEPGERRGDAAQSQEPPHSSVVNTEEKESSAVSKSAAGGERRDNVSGEQPWASGTNDTVKNVSKSCCGPSTEVSVVCAPSAELKVEGGTAKAASAVGPVSQPQDGNVSPWKTSGEGREEARGGEAAFPGTSSAPAPAVPAGGNPSGEGEGEGLAEMRRGAEHAASTSRPDAQPPTCSSNLPCGGGITESAPAGTVTPGPAPTATALPAAAGTALTVGTEPHDGTSSAGEWRELQCGLEEHSLALPPQQPLPTADRHGSAVPGQELCAAAGQSCAEETPTLAEENGPDQLWPRGEEPEGLCPPSQRKDATDVVCGLILELSNLNRLVMSAHRGLAALRRPKLRRSRQPGLGPVPSHAGKRWKET